MKRLVRVLCNIALLAMLWSTPLSVHAAQRIVSLKPNITEIVFALGAGDRVVGVTSWCNYPAAARQLPKVADYLRPNLEAVLALQPNLIIASKENALRRPVEKLRRHGIKLLLVSFQSVDKTFAAIRQIGNAVEAEDAAQKLVAQLKSGFAPVAGAETKRPRVLLLVGKHPWVAAGPTSFLGELLEAAGGRNVITARRPAYPYLSLERMIAAAPDVIIDATVNMGRSVSLRAQRSNPVGTTGLPRPLRDLAMTSIDIELLRAGPRMGVGLLALRKAMMMRD